MVARLLLLLMFILIAGCTGNVAYRPFVFVPETSVDIVRAQVKEGEIGSAVCQDEAHVTNMGLCSVECAYVNGDSIQTGVCKRDGSAQDLAYKLFFVELDEQGRFYDDRQFQYLLDYLKTRSKPHTCKNTDGTESQKGLSIVTIVHGWRHNAKENDNNVKDAKEILKATYKAEAGGDYVLDCKKREVVGIYVGWRGKSLTTTLNWWGYDPLELASIYDRKSTALSVSMGSVREVLSVLQQFISQREPHAKRENCNIYNNDPSKDHNLECKLDRLIIVGHSFGGLIVFNALSEELLDSITRDYFNGNGDPPKVKLNADLVVLINPAIEGIKFEPIFQAIKRRNDIYTAENNIGGFDPNQKPVFVSITADNDFATGMAFPFARYFSTLFESTSPSSEMGLALSKVSNSINLSKSDKEKLINADIDHYKKMAEDEHVSSIRSIGFVDRYRTHSLFVENAKEGTAPSCIYGDDLGAALAFEGQVVKSRDRYYTGDHKGDYCGGITLSYDATGGLPYNSPIWIVKSKDIRIMDNHSGYRLADGYLIIPFIQQLYHQLTLADVVK